jgi:hypothetical protein
MKIGPHSFLNLGVSTINGSRTFSVRADTDVPLTGKKLWIQNRSGGPPIDGTGKVYDSTIPLDKPSFSFDEIFSPVQEFISSTALNQSQASQDINVFRGLVTYVQSSAGKGKQLDIGFSRSNYPLSDRTSRFLMHGDPFECDLSHVLSELNNTFERELTISNLNIPHIPYNLRNSLVQACAGFHLQDVLSETVKDGRDGFEAKLSLTSGDLAGLTLQTQWTNFGLKEQEIFFRYLREGDQVGPYSLKLKLRDVAFGLTTQHLMQFHKLAAEIFVQELTETLRESRESQTETQIAAQVDFIGNTDPDLRGLRISVESPNGTVRSASITSAGFDWAKNEQSFSGETITTTPDNIAQHTQFFTENLPLDLIRLTGA